MNKWKYIDTSDATEITFHVGEDGWYYSLSDEQKETIKLEIERKTRNLKQDLEKVVQIEMKRDD